QELKLLETRVELATSKELHGFSLDAGNLVGEFFLRATQLVFALSICLEGRQLIVARILTETGVHRLQTSCVVSVLELVPSRFDHLIEINLLGWEIQLNTNGRQIGSWFLCTKLDLLCRRYESVQGLRSFEIDSLDLFFLVRLEGCFVECGIMRIHEAGRA